MPSGEPHGFIATADTDRPGNQAYQDMRRLLAQVQAQEQGRRN